MLKLGAERRELRVVADQVGAPTWANTVATSTSHIVAQGLAAGDMQWWRDRSGVYHLTAAGNTSWHGFAQAIFDMTMGHSAARLLPIRTSDYPTPAIRPANSRMSHGKLTDTFGLQLPDWRHALALCLDVV
jgi:dTDP-4-dehydrorhamnose reductase